MKSSYFAKLAAFFWQSLIAASLLVPAALAHNLDTLATSISLDNEFMEQVAQRAANQQVFFQNNDEFWILIKTTPGPGTNTGVGGYQTFYIPDGVSVIDAAYVLPDPSDPRGFRNIAMKVQSPIAIGNGSVSNASTPEFDSWGMPSTECTDFKVETVTDADR